MPLTTTLNQMLEIELEDRPGTLGALATVLGKENINIQGFTVTPHDHLAVARLLTNDPANARPLLEAAGYHVGLRDALVVAMPNAPGELGRVASFLGEREVNILASFVTSDATTRRLRCAFVVDDRRRAQRAIEDLARMLS